MSSGIVSGEICWLIVKLWLMHCCESFFTKNGHMANLPEKDSNVTPKKIKNRVLTVLPNLKLEVPSISVISTNQTQGYIQISLKS